MCRGTERTRRVEEDYADAAVGKENAKKRVRLLSPSRRLNIEKEVFGGDFLSGKTSNIELDAVFQRYLPTGSVLECTTLPCLTRRSLEGIRSSLQRRGKMFFPMFLRHHWMAGILTCRHGVETLTTYDSAPSPVVREDLRRVLDTMWPDLHREEGFCPRQKRGSDDCGLFMTATFFADYLNVTVRSQDSISKRLRLLLQRTKVEEIPKKLFLKLMREELERETTLLEGGAPKARNAARDRTLDSGAAQATQRSHNQQQEVTDPQIVSADEESIETIEEHRDRAVDAVGNMVKKMIENAPQSLEVARRRKISYFLIATALANVADGKDRSLHINNIGKRVNDFRFGRQTHRDITDALRAMRFSVNTWEGDRTSGVLKEVISRERAWMVRVTGESKLPYHTNGKVFRIGAVLEQEGEESFYTLTENVEEAVVGVYLPVGMTSYQPLPQLPMRRQPPQPNGTARQQMTEQDVVDVLLRDVEEEEDELVQILESEPESLLNREGSPYGGTVTCPRNWHIFRDKPPHIELGAWNSITRNMRLHHIRCLMKLRAMPARFLQQGIATAVVRSVFQDARARGWRPTTIDKELSAMAGALRDLPMYTTEAVGIQLKDFPDWNATKRTIVRLMREHPTSPPAPVTIDQCHAAIRSLKGRQPKAALFLAMMWALAARAGDISGLKKEDVKLETSPREDGTYGLSIVQRRGKGAKTRGVYSPSATLMQEEATELSRLLAGKSKTQFLFPDHEQLRDYVRVALKRQNRESALPSVRKGAIQHLADLGVSYKDLMELTGHTRIDTLKIYLDSGRHQTREAAIAQDSAALLHQQRQNG